MNKVYTSLYTLYHTYQTDPCDRELREGLNRDLNMEALFHCLDHTLSAPGRQYLYHLLHAGKKTDVE